MIHNSPGHKPEGLHHVGSIAWSSLSRQVFPQGVAPRNYWMKGGSGRTRGAQSPGGAPNRLAS